jgi:hypothetical protein
MADEGIPRKSGAVVRWAQKNGNTSTGYYLGMGYDGNLNTGIKTYAIVIKDIDGRVLQLPYSIIQFVKDDTGQQP